MAATSWTSALLALRRQRFEVAFENCLERLLVLPFGIFWRKLLDPVERERHLHVHGLLAPQRAVVVESRDALGRRHEIRRALFRHPGDERDDGLFRGSIVPGRQRVGRWLIGANGRANAQRA